MGDNTLLTLVTAVLCIATGVGFLFWLGHRYSVHVAKIMVEE